MKLIIDTRMPKEIKEYLQTYGQLIEIQPQPTTYEEISAHPDIYFCKINNTLFQAPNINLKLGIPGTTPIQNKYPNDIPYNICQIGNNIIHNFKHTDPKVHQYINTQKLNKIQVNQGYAKCSTIPTSQNSCITSDPGISQALKSQNIDTLLLTNDTIHLLNKNGQKTKMNGFIGGAAAIIQNTFILFGNIQNLTQKQQLINHIHQHNLTLKDFPNQPPTDYGGIIITH